MPKKEKNRLIFVVVHQSHFQINPKIRKTFRESLVKDKIIPYTVDEVLAHIVNFRMTKNVYH